LTGSHLGSQDVEVLSRICVGLRSTSAHGVRNCLVDLVNGGISDDQVLREDAADGIFVVASVTSASGVVDLNVVG
jgi:hypothetical protein